MIARVVLICLLKIDRSDYIHKGVSFAHKHKKIKKLNNAVLIDANSLTQLFVFVLVLISIFLFV